MINTTKDQLLKSVLENKAYFDLSKFDLTLPNDIEELVGSGNKMMMNVLKAIQRLLRVAPSQSTAESLYQVGFQSAHQIAAMPEHQFVRSYSQTVGGSGTARQVHQRATQVVEHVRLHAMNALSLNEESFAASPVVSNAPLNFYNGLPNYEELFGSLNFAQCQECQSILSPTAYFVDLMRLIDGYVSQPGNEQLSLRTRRPDLWTLPLTCESANQEVPYLQIVNQILEAQVKSQASALGHSVTDPMAQLATAIYPFELPFNDPLVRVRRLLKHFNLSLAEIYEDLLVGKASGDVKGSIAREMLQISPEKYALLTTPNTDESSLLQAYGMGSKADLSTLSNAAVFRNQTQLNEAQLETLLSQNTLHKLPVKQMPESVLGFDGATQIFLDNPGDLRLTGDMTLEFWLNPANFNNRYNPICKAACGEFAVTQEDGSKSPAGLLNFYCGSDGTFDESGAHLQFSVNPNDPLLVNQWVHVAVVRDVTKLQLTGYLNGEQTGTLALPSGYSVKSSNCNIQIGCGYTSPYEGQIGEVRLWNQVRTQDEIVANMRQRLPGSQSGLAGYWPLDEGSGTTVNDLSGNVNPGTLQVATTGSNSAGDVLSNPQWGTIEAFQWKPQGTTAKILGQFFINQSLSGGSYLGLAVDKTTGAQTINVITPANATSQPLNSNATFDRLHRFIRLAQSLDWFFADTDLALRSIEPAPNTKIDPSAIKSLATMSKLKSQLGLQVDELCALWSDMDTFGVGKGKIAEDLFDKVFNYPTSFANLSGQVNTSLYHPTYSPNPLYTDDVISWTPFATNQPGTPSQNSALRGRLRGALQIKDAELYLLTRYLNPGADATTTIQLDVPTLSVFYRHSRLARALNQPMGQFLVLLELLQSAGELGQDFTVGQVWSVATVAKIVEWVDWMRATKINVAQLEYLTTGDINPFITPVYNPNAIQSLIESIQNDIANGTVGGNQQNNNVIQLLSSFFNVSFDLTQAALNFTCQSLKVDNSNNKLLVEVSSETSTVAQATSLIEACGLNLYLAQTFNLSSQDLNGMAATPGAFKLAAFGSSFQLTLQNLCCIAIYKKLCASFGATDQLLSYFSQPSVATLSQITDWPADQITELENFWPTKQFDTVESVAALARCFNVAQTLGVDIGFVLELRQLNALNLGGANAAPSGTVWQSYQTAVQQLSQTVVAQYGTTQIAQVMASIQSECEELKRDILVSYVLWLLSFTFDDIKTTDDLYDFLLIDVDMSSMVQISPLKAGLNSLQLYAQTTQLNLESDVTNHIPRDWWAWMSHYRVWQANREIYLYPENYVSPELRKFKTPVFEELESALQQGSLTPELVEGALTNYLEGLSAVSNLEIVASYRAKVQMPGAQSGNGEGVDTVFLFGRTRTQPATFYHRTLRITDHHNPEKGIWTPWEQLNLTINAETITPVYAFNKLFVFWVEQIQKSVSVNSQNNQIVTADIKYSYQKLNRDWAAFQTLEQGVVISVVGPATAYFSPRVDAPTWNKVRVLTQSDADSLVILYGDLANYGFSGGNKPTPVGNIEIDRYNNMWWDALGYANTLQEEGKGYVTTVVPPWTLSSTLACDRVRLKLNPTVANYCMLGIPGQEASQLIYNLYGTVIPDSVIAWPVCCFPMNNEELTDVISNQTASVTNSSYSWGNTSCPLRDSSVLAFGDTGGFYGNVSIGNVSFTAEIWLQITDTDSFSSYLLSLGSSDSDAYVVTKDSSPTYNISCGQLSQSTFAPTKLGTLTDEWACLTITLDTETKEFSLYLNGDYQGKVAVTGGINVQKIYLGYIGYSAGGYDLGYTGFLAQITVWKSILSPGYIKFRADNPNAVFPNYENLILRYPAESTEQLVLLPSKVSSYLGRVEMVGNQPGWATFDNGDEAFLVLPQGDPFKSSAEIVTISQEDQVGDFPLMTISYGDAAKDSGSFVFSDLKLQFLRLTSNIAPLLEKRLLSQGLDATLSLSSQYLPELNFNRFQSSSSVVAPASQLMDFSGAYGEYFWELFFYAPFLIANTFCANQRFQLAQKWYQYVFNPTQDENTDGLVSYWPLAGNANDPVGGNNGMVAQHESPAFVQMDFVDGSTRTVFNSSSGSSNSASPGNPADLNLTSAITLEGWCRFTSLDGDDSWIIRKQCDVNDDPWNVYKLSVPNNTKLFTFSLSVNGVYQDVASTEPPNFNEWYYVVGTYDGTNLKLYVNGKLLDTANAPGTIGTSSQSIYFGGDSFFGQLANLGIWDRALSQEEIAANYARKSPQNRFWRFRPFVNLSLDSIQDDLSNPQQIAVYEYDPFDPDAIARLRAGAYPKAMVMRYVANLLRWGNKLFAKYTWETISEATLLYTEALDLLGPQPKQVGALPAPPARTVDDFITEYGAAKDIPEFLVELENTLPALPDNDGVTRTLPFNLLNSYFCVPVNRGMLALWQEADNQLYKIRHGENIKGQPQQLSLYGAPLNPMALAKGGAAGAVSSGAKGGGATTIPYYRFSYLIQQAKELAGQVSQLGSALLGALEKQDAEQLSILLNNNEAAILNLSTQIKQNQIEQLQQTAQSLQAGLAAAQLRQQTYGAWLQGQSGPDGSATASQSDGSPDGDWTQSLSGGEETSLALTYIAAIAHTEAGIMRAISSAFYLLPDIFGFADGGMNFGGSVEAIAGTFDSAGGVLTTTSQLISSVTQFQRREQDWTLQYQLAGYDIEQIQAQLAANQTETASAQQDLKINQQQIAQNQAVGNFYQTKFTNQQLYQWMAGRLSTLYFQGYQLAFELAQEAQTAYQYENNSSKNFLDYGAWDSLEKGLTAADTLALSLSQLEKANIDAGVRHLEIEKTISLSQLDPQALITLKQTGTCSFNLTEQLYDYDYPGHYNRKIATIALTIPAIVGPYQNLHATLTQTANYVVIQPDINAVEYLLSGTGTAPASIRSNCNVNQEIAISRGVNDSGLFVLNFDDPRYLPFEGTGAVSSWTLDMPQAANAIDFNSISDVIIQLSYTAQDGGESFRQAVTAQPLIASFDGARMLSLRQNFPEAWHLFKNGNAATRELQFPILRAMFPVNLKPGSVMLGDSTTGVIGVQWLVAEGDTTGLPSLSLNGQSVSGGSVALVVPDQSATNAPVNLSDFGPSVKNSLTAGGEIPKQVEDVILIIPFVGALAWPKS